MDHGADGVPSQMASARSDRTNPTLTGSGSSLSFTLSKPARFGGYRILAKLGQGGMAEVYLAVAGGAVQDFRKLVVLKVLHDNFCDDERFVEMFVKEARLAARLSHPNVVHTYTVGEQEGRYCIVMEYLEGASLSAFLKRTSHLPFGQRLPLIAAVSQALTGLHYVHEFRDYDGTHLSLIHRDIKPGNIFITFDGQVKVLDFGVAKVLASEEATASALVKGTVQYMAPEALDVTCTVDRRLDVFAAGLVIWEMARGRRLWHDFNQLQILRCLTTGELPDFDGGADSEIDAELIEICRRAIAPKPSARYATALELKRALDVYLAKRGQSVGTEALVTLADDVFGFMRERRLDAIRQRLATVEAEGPEEEGIVPTFVPTFTSASQSTVRTNRPPGGTVAEELARSRWAWVGVALFAGGAVVLLVATVLMVWTNRTNQPTLAQSSESQAPSVVPATVVLRQTASSNPTPREGPIEAPPAIEHATVLLSVHPADAKLFLDGYALSANPAELVRERDNSTHTLSASATGYLPWETEITWSENRRLEIALESLPRVEEAARRTARRSAPRRNVERQVAVAVPSSEPESVGTAVDREPPRPGDDLKVRKRQARRASTDIDAGDPWAE